MPKKLPADSEWLELCLHTGLDHCLQVLRRTAFV